MKIISVEDQIIQATIKAFLVRGYLISVNDGEETTVKKSVDRLVIFEAMKTTDEDYLQISKPGRVYGWVRFVYGNEDHDVINDYTMNLEPVMSEINTMIDNYLMKRG